MHISHVTQCSAMQDCLVILYVLLAFPLMMSQRICPCDAISIEKLFTAINSVASVCLIKIN